MPLETENLVLGSGKMFFEPFAPGLQDGQGEWYLGNTPNLRVSRQVSRKQKFSSAKTKLTPNSIIFAEANEFIFATDNISKENLEFWFGDTESPSAITLSGALRFLSDNAYGTNFDYYAPLIYLTPDSEFDLKSVDFQELKFTATTARKSLSNPAVIVERQIAIGTYTPPIPEGFEAAESILDEVLNTTMPSRGYPTP